MIPASYFYKDLYRRYWIDPPAEDDARDFVDEAAKPRPHTGLGALAKAGARLVRSTWALAHERVRAEAQRGQAPAATACGGADARR